MFFAVITVVAIIAISIAQMKRRHPVSLFDKALEAYSKGDHKTAHTEFTWLAKQEDKRAMFFIGEMYENGNGVTQDYVLAYMWFNLAVLNGNMYSRKYDAEKRDLVATKMTSEQIAEAKRLTHEWLAKNKT